LIADLPVTMDSEVLAEAEDAAVAIARFDSTLGGEITPFSAVLLRSEATAPWYSTTRTSHTQK
jgi:hypothetical protein